VDVTPEHDGADRSAVALVEQSFEWFYAQHRNAIGRALAITLRDDTLAADALDEAMTRAYQRWQEVSTTDNPAGWVYRVALNWARSFLRKVTRAGRGPRAMELVSTAPTFDPDIDRALRELTIDQRAVIVCRYFIGYSEAETAAVLGIRPGTAKSRHSRAIATLRASASLDESQDLGATR
jgi:RNA polymerase sigma-70 factor (ECF subfamily)